MSDNLEIPTNLPAEDALLGALLQYPNEVTACVLIPGHFYDWKNQDVYDLIRTIADAGKEPNFYTIVDALKKKDKQEIGIERLEYLRNCFYHQKSLETLQFEILEAYRKRTAIAELQGEMARLFKADENTEGIFSDMVSKITKISESGLLEDLL